MRDKADETLSLPDAARTLGLSWAATWRLMLVGALTGERDALSGRWRVTRESLDAVLNLRQTRKMDQRDL